MKVFDPHKCSFTILLATMICLPWTTSAAPGDEKSATATATEATSGELNNHSSTLSELAQRLNFGAEMVKVVWLDESNPGQQLAVYQAPFSSPIQGGVVVLLGPGEIVEGNEFARAVRQRLSTNGWGVLVAQGSATEVSDSAETLHLVTQGTLKNAERYLRGAGFTKVVVVARNMAAAAVWPLVQAGELPLSGFVSIGDWEVENFAAVTPMLDIVNANQSSALQKARKRFLQMKQNPETPFEIYSYDGPLRGDRGYGESMSKRIRGWLVRQFEKT